MDEIDVHLAGFGDQVFEHLELEIVVRGLARPSASLAGDVVHFRPRRPGIGWVFGDRAVIIVRFVEKEQSAIAPVFPEPKRPIA